MRRTYHRAIYLMVDLKKTTTTTTTTTEKQVFLIEVPYRKVKEKR